MSDKTWIEEQKANRLFRGGGNGGDAHRMLEHSETNRILNKSQAKKFTSARMIGDVLGIDALDKFCTMLEKSQMCVGAETRQNFMKVAIEQWQGKLSHNKKITLENLV